MEKMGQERFEWRMSLQGKQSRAEHDEKGTIFKFINLITLRVNCVSVNNRCGYQNDEELDKDN